MYYSKIIGTGAYLPEKRLTNADLEKMVDTSNEWIIERTGISERRIAADDETTSSLAYNASVKAINNAGLENSDIDLIIVGTCTGDRFFPSTGCLLQEKLGIEKNIPAFDITAACSGFVYALTIADQFIKAGIYKNALVVGAEVLSRGIDWTDRNTCVLFGDGAGAVVLQQSTEPGVVSSDLYSQGKHKEILSLPNLVTAPPKDESVTRFVTMNGREVFKLASILVEQAMEKTIADNNLTVDDIDWVIPHQANGRIMMAISKKIGIPMEKFVSTIGLHGNTSAASIPLALAEGVENGQIKPGQLLMLEGFGGGMTWGSILVRF